MKKIISILTATRAEYGLLKPIISKLNMVKNFDIRIVVTGMHLSKSFGLTYQEIEGDNLVIDKKIDILIDSDTSADISKIMGNAMFGFADYFNEIKPDLLIVLGDRYETLAVCIAAMNAKIPIAHLYGGEITEGAIDEAIRHAITKMSYLHFTSTHEYRKRVIQLGESPERVFTVGAVGIENIKSAKLLTKHELEESLGLIFDKPFAIVTYHPETLNERDVIKEIRNVLYACNANDDLFYIFTKANSDANGLIINKIIEEYTSEHDNTKLFPSLGMTRYLSALKYCTMVIGNSSSGIIEAPSFGIPTINIGDRQKGRMQSTSVINVKSDIFGLDQAIKLAKSEGFNNIAKNTFNPYGDGNTSGKVISIIKEFILEEKINLKKEFYNIDFEVKNER